MILMDFIKELLPMCKDVAIALAPMILLFGIFQIFFLKLKKRQVIRKVIGLLYTWVGLVLFLVGVNVGFAPAGEALGEALGAMPNNWLLVPIGMLLGAILVFAEPSVHVLNRQVEEVSGGQISRHVMLVSLAIAVSLAIGVSMLRVLTGISLWYFLVPGYALGLALMFFVPQMFTSIAFDSGAVATGPITVTFILPLATGAASFIEGSNPVFDAFGVVALVAMMPVIVVQLLALIYQYRAKRSEDALQYLDAPELVEDNSVLSYKPTSTGAPSNATLTGGDGVDSTK